MSVELTSSRLLLRCGQPRDADPLYEAARESVATVGRWLPWCHSGYQLEDAAARIELMREQWRRETAFPFFIFTRADGRLVGGCHVNELKTACRAANLGYWVRRTAEGQGYATEAARMAARWAFENLYLLRLEIVAALGNVPSQRVALKVGATPEGVWRNRIRIQRRQYHARGYSLIPSDLANW